MLPYPKRDRLTRFQREMRLDCNGEHYSSPRSCARWRHSKPLQLHNHHTKEIQAERLALIKLLAPGKKPIHCPENLGQRQTEVAPLRPGCPAHTLMHRCIAT